MRSSDFKSQRGHAYGDRIRLSVIKEFLSGARRKDLALKYNIYDASIISTWIRKFKAETHKSGPVMNKKRKKGLVTPCELSLEQENARLRKSLASKEKELERERLRSRAYDIMIDIAEEKLGIDIRKKSGPKR